MIDWFYLKHRRKAYSRDRSRDKGCLVGLVLSVVLFQFCRLLYIMHQDLVINYQFLVNVSVEEAHWHVLVMFLILGAMIMLILSPPVFDFLPYSIWKVKKHDLSAGYLLWAPFSAPNVVMIVLSIPFLLRSGDVLSGFWLPYLISWIGIYYFVIAVHHAPTKLPKRTIGIVLFSTIIGLNLLGLISLPTLSIISSLVMLIFSLGLAFASMQRYQVEYGADVETRSQSNFNQITRFKHPLMQLEWALMTRNKRTRGNLIAGLVSIPVVLYLFTQTADDVAIFPIVFIGIIVTAFVMLQHGIYSLGWEGSYFDLLISKFSFEEIFSFKYRFFVISSFFMFVISLSVTLWNPSLFLPLTAAFFYNIGINTYIVLQGMLSNRVKLTLDQSTIFNTQALNGTLMVNSLLIILVPTILLMIFKSYSNETYASIILAGIGIVGLLFQKPFLAQLDKKAQTHKYALAKGYRS